MTPLVTRLTEKRNITLERENSKYSDTPATTSTTITIISSSSGDFEELIFFKLNIRYKNILHHRTHEQIVISSLIATRNEIIKVYEEYIHILLG